MMFQFLIGISCYLNILIIPETPTKILFQFLIGISCYLNPCRPPKQLESRIYLFQFLIGISCYLNFVVRQFLFELRECFNSS